MKVWIVQLETHYESTTLEGVYSSEEKAIAKMHALTSTLYAPGGWRECSHTELESRGQTLSVTELEVDA